MCRKVKMYPIYCSQIKEPIYFYISEGSMHDIKASYKFLPSLPKNFVVIGDKGYVSNELKNFLKN